MSDRYLLHTPIEPFMKTQNKQSGYATSYAQIRVHHGTHIDFPPHVELDGSPTREISGPAVIRTPDELVANDNEVLPLGEVFDTIPEIILFDAEDEDLPEAVVERVIEEERVRLIGMTSKRPGGREIHRELLGNGIGIVENLINLDLPDVREGYAQIYPVVIKGCDDGAPTVVTYEPLSDQ